MILAAPLVIPFAEAVGLSVATLGMAKVADMVNEYIQENPEQSMKILSTIVPGVGIGEIFMKKGKDEEVEEEVSIEDMDPRDLTREEKAKEMKRRFKEGTGSKREIGRKGYEEVIQPGEDRTLEEADERYEGGIDDAPKPKFDYKKFFKKRYADGGSIGIEVLFEEKKPRQGLFMGGSPLEGQALNIYNSMNAYGFSDQEIANALEGQGLYTPGSTPVVEEPVTNTVQNIINQGGGDGPPNDPPKDPYGGLGYSSANFGLGKGINKDAVMDYEADAYQQGRTLTGQLNKIGLGIFSALKNIPTPFNLVRMGIQKAKDIARQKEIEKEMQQAAIARDIARSNKESGTGGYQAGYDSGFMEGPSGAGYGMGAADKGGSDTMGSFARGGLATMFKEKR